MDKYDEGAREAWAKARQAEELRLAGLPADSSVGLIAAFARRCAEEARLEGKIEGFRMSRELVEKHYRSNRLRAALLDAVDDAIRALMEKP